jgi:hypothetical protein
MIPQDRGFDNQHAQSLLDLLACSSCNKYFVTFFFVTIFLLQACDKKNFCQILLQLGLGLLYFDYQSFVPDVCLLGECLNQAMASSKGSIAQPSGHCSHSLQWPEGCQDAVRYIKRSRVKI